MSTLSTFAIKLDSFYVAYAPEFDLCSYGDCQDEALNNLTDELRQVAGAEQGRLTTKGIRNARG